MCLLLMMSFIFSNAPQAFPILSSRAVISEPSFDRIPPRYSNWSLHQLPLFRLLLCHCCCGFSYEHHFCFWKVVFSPNSAEFIFKRLIMQLSLVIDAPITSRSSAYALFECLMPPTEMHLPTGLIVFSIMTFKAMQNSRAYSVSPCLTPFSMGICSVMPMLMRIWAFELS